MSAAPKQERPNDESNDEIRLMWFETLAEHGVLILRLTLLAAVLAFGYAAFQSWRAPERLVASLEFSLTFAQSREGQYPNGLPFGVGDITAGPIVDMVHTSNAISDYCPLQPFREGLFVELYSPEAQLIDLDYQGRLSDSRLTVVQREQLQQEYLARRATVSGHYRLTFVRAPLCARLPAELVTKTLADVLRVWAEESEIKRGVSNIQINVLTPAVFDVTMPMQDARLIRADLVRTAIRRVMQMITQVGAVPGAELVRLNNVNIAEIRARMGDLNSAWMEPLVMASAVGGGRDAAAWVENALATARRAETTARARSEEYRRMLAEFSGLSGAVGTGPTGPKADSGPSDVQALSPQFDRTFVDRILEMSESYVEYRKELTTSAVTSGVDAVGASDTVAYYERLLAAIRQPTAPQFTKEEIDARIEAVVSEAKALTGKFNELYQEISRVMFRPTSGLYQVLQPVNVQTVKAFDSRRLIILPALAGGVALFGAFVFFLARRHLRQRRYASPQ